ncbi:kelch-like protein 40b [Tetranychus urticae]|uniref:kelch-like protein 40b n=1 Tax=Tetranychus urticae TaxID=32264 RepID=UPI00077BF9AC|nr:kelch-like protein 40b [Tetranychus urticae]
MGNVQIPIEVSSHQRIPSLESSESFFGKNFTVQHIPALINHLKNETSVNYNMLNSFLSRNFLRLINGEYFLEFPLEAVKYILSLDLCVETEYSIFQAILNWIQHDQCRIVHLQELLKCIRWCYTFKTCYLHIKENEFMIKNLPDELDALSCEPNECRNSCFNSRIKEKHLISLYFLAENKIGMSLYTGDNFWSYCASFDEDDQIPIGVISEEHVVDVIFDSGRTGVRFDLVQKKYRFLDMSGSPSAYYNQLHDCFKPKFDRESSYRAYIQDGVKKIEDWVDLQKNTLIEYKGEMHIICYTQKEQKLYVFLPVEHVHWYNSPFAEHRIHACIVNDVCYIITKSLSFRVFDMLKKTIEKSKPFADMHLSFDDLQMDQHKSNIILLIKSLKKIMMFDTRKKVWTLMGQIHFENKMIALTSTYMPVQFIKKMYAKS